MSQDSEHNMATPEEYLSRYSEHELRTVLRTNGITVGVGETKTQLIINLLGFFEGLSMDRISHLIASSVKLEISKENRIQISNLRPPDPYLSNPGEPRTTIEDWLEEFKIYFDLSNANFLSLEKQIAMYLHHIGSEARRILKVNTRSISSLSDLVDLTLKEFGMKRTVLKERQKFRNLKQLGSVKDFANKLKLEVRFCNFKINEEDMLIDQFLWGMKDFKTKRKVLLLDEINFYKLVQLAEIEEEVGADFAEVTSNNYSENRVFNIGKRGSGLGRYSRCFKYYNSGIGKCPAFRKKCNFCGLIGHFWSACRKRKAGETVRSIKSEGSSEEENKETKSVNRILNVFEGTEQKLLKVKILVNLLPTEMIIDTDSPVSIINENTAKAVCKNKKYVECKSVLKSYTNDRIRILGEIEAELKLGNRSTSGRIIIVKNGTNLLGLNEIKKLGVWT